MNSMSLISVIMFCFNAEEFIEQCIQSILPHTFEYVIIDMGSDTGSGDI